MKIKKILIMVGLTGVILLFGYLLGRTSSGNTSDTSKQKSATSSAESKKIIWTCSMHPQIRMEKPGKCPICSMTLIPLQSSTDDSRGAKAELKLSPSAVKLAEIQTFPVIRKYISSTIRMTGKIVMNEQLMAYITARMPGRIDKLFVNYTGIAVKKGDHMAEYYSPELLVAQRELLLAVKDLKKQDDNSYKGYGMTPEQTLAAVKKKLIYWGLTQENIAQIIKNAKVVQHITLYAPVGGIVTEKNALEGKYFKTGDRLFTIADLSQVWVMLEAYETDVPKLRYGQKVKFYPEAYPGEAFTGRISFIDPIMNKKTRVINVRVDASNPQGKLKPGMFVRALVTSDLSANGQVIMDSSLAGKWVCPMHPDVIKDSPGKCDICGMDLVKPKALGYSSSDSKDSEPPLVIPVSAPLITGKRAVVYVQTAPGKYQGKEVILGPRGDGFYIVKSGLKEGDLVVTNGNFKIDSSLQIMAKPSMMTASDVSTEENLSSSQLKIPVSFKKQLDMIYNSYFKVQKALAKDDFKAAIAGAKNLKMMLGHISPKSLKGESKTEWEKLGKDIANIAGEALKTKNINDFRANFANLTALIDDLADKFGTSSKIKLTKFKCPMAFDNKGAQWLQESEKIANPYLGKAMPECGEKIKK